MEATSATKLAATAAAVAAAALAGFAVGKTRGWRDSQSFRRRPPIVHPSHGADPSFYAHGGKLIIVTGGASGVGAAVVSAFVRHGAYVAFADRDAKSAAKLLDQHEAERERLLFVEADLADAAAATRVVTAARAWRQGAAVDVLVNNVGVQQNNMPVHLLREADWDKVHAVNLKSYFLFSKACLPPMLERRAGVILNMASVQGQQSQVGIPAYASSKGAILSLTRQMAMDYSSSGVRVLSISPGTILTDLVRQNIAEEGASVEGIGAQYPLGRVGEPEDLGELCVFLASERARNLTGSNVHCDGGIMAMGSWGTRVGLASMGL
jgi:NAD(P)-dependent dehydrogenase (short-subunit alcohol dehydrogenase family)